MANDQQCLNVLYFDLRRSLIGFVLNDLKCKLYVMGPRWISNVVEQGYTRRIAVLVYQIRG